MENMNNQQKKEVPQIKIGEYQFYVQGVARKDSNGYDLKTSKGHKYERLRLIILDGEQSHTVYKMILGRRDIEEIVKAIDNPALTNVFKIEDEDFDSETLIGEQGRLLLGRRFHNGNNYPQVECFLKPRPQVSPPKIESQTFPEPKSLDESLEDDVPF